MEMTKIKWDEDMLVRCLVRCNDPFSAVKPMTVVDKPRIVIEKTPPKVKYWDEFKMAIDGASQN